MGKYQHWFCNNHTNYDLVSSLRKFVIFVLAFVFLLPHLSHSKEMRQEEELIVRLSVDENNISQSDSVLFSAVIKNISMNSIVLDSKQNPYGIAYIKIFDEAGIELESEITRVFDMKLLNKDDFVELEPGDDITMQFIAKMRSAEEHVLDNSQDGKYFLDFDSCGIVIPKKGTYSTTFQFLVKYKAAKYDERIFNLDNVWYGSVISNPVIIHVI